MTLEAWFEDLLPTKWSRRVALATIGIAGGAFGVPSILPQSYLPESQEEIFLLRIILFLFVAVIGIVVVLSLVVFRASNLQARSIGGAAIVDEPDAQLSEAHQRVLRLLFEEPKTVEEVRQSLETNREEANYYLQDLLERGMVHHPAPYAPGPEKWSISQKGRQFIIQENEP